MRWVTVLGAGSWGTALAMTLARNGQQCCLWDRNPALLSAMSTAGENFRYLPGIPLPQNLHLETNFDRACEQADVILIAIPSGGFRSILEQVKRHREGLKGIVWATKGVEHGSGLLLHQVFEAVLPELPYAILVGPSFAVEVAANLPTAINLASRYSAFAHDFLPRIHQRNFRVYTSEDIIGVQVGSAVKNVLALAVGIADGLGFGVNARSALITRGLHEMIRLGEAMGAEAKTLMGLAGLGDLVLTASDNKSRNRRFGVALGKHLSIDDAKAEIDQVIEGIDTTREVHRLAEKFQVDMPICLQAYRILYENVSADTAADDLLMRMPKAEGS